MTRTDDLSPHKRRQIIDGAATVFTAEGYEGASMAGIAKAAAVSKGTLYNHFDSKAELFTAWVAEKCEEYVAQVFDSALSPLEPAAALQIVGCRLVRLFTSKMGITVYRLVMSEAAKFPELARTFHAVGPSRMIGKLAALLDEADAAGTVRVADTTLAAEQFIALCQTRFRIQSELHILERLSEDDIAFVVGRAVDMFLATYGRDPCRTG